jgi:hypothetical protein
VALTAAEVIAVDPATPADQSRTPDTPLTTS